MNEREKPKICNHRNITWYIFYTLFIIFCIAIAVMLTPNLNRLLVGDWFLLCSGIILLLLGSALIILTVKQKIIGILRVTLILNGVSAIGIPISILLHNIIYGSLMLLFGQDFWHGGDEPVFFVLALIVFPIVFIVSSLISIVINIRQIQVHRPHMV
jgi:hypothetical protein